MSMQTLTTVDLSCVIDRLAEYDDLRTTLEREGGHLADFRRLTQLLAQTFEVPGYFRDHTVSLTDPKKVLYAVQDLAGWDTYFEVRQLANQMQLPVYYLCRTDRDYWNTYSLIVEDYYRSEAFPLVDERFARLMVAGHEQYFLRMSPFREAVQEILPTPWNSPPDVDKLLLRVGRHVLQAAWHDDQRPGILTSHAFELPRFRHAFELAYLALGADLCTLRELTDETLLRFFEDVYPQPALRSFLQRLGDLDGQALYKLTEIASGGFKDLTRAFHAFVNIDVQWGLQTSSVRLYKLIFANMSRLHLVASAVAEQPTVTTAREELERKAQSVVDRILDA